MPTIANMSKVNDIVISGAITEAHTLLRTQTASSSATLAFSTRIDSTFDVYEFHFENMHPATDAAEFTFQVNAAGASGFNEVITSTKIQSYHNEADSDNALSYASAYDQAQGTAYQTINTNGGFDNDQGCSGVLTLYAPSSKTYVKHFTSNMNGAHSGDVTIQALVAGYINVTSAIDEISFAMSSGNIDAGVIKMYGIAKA